jgi:hypothetical protein
MQARTALTDNGDTHLPPLPPINKDLARLLTEQKSEKPREGYAYESYTKHEQFEFFKINIMQEIKIKSPEHAQLFSDPNLIDILDEKHYRNDVALKQNYFFQLMESLYWLRAATVKASQKIKEKPPGREKLNGIIKETAALEAKVLGGLDDKVLQLKEKALPDDNSTEVVTTITTVSHQVIIASPKTPRKVRKQFVHDYHDILLNSAKLADEMARAHVRAMARRDANSFQYERRMFALSTTIRAATAFIKDLKCADKSKELATMLERLQNSIESPTARFMREYPALTNFMCAMTTLLGLGLVIGGLMLAPVNPVTSMQLMVAGTVIGTSGLAVWTWTPFKRLLAPDEDFSTVAQSSTSTVTSFRALIESATTFFNRYDYSATPARSNAKVSLRARF